MNSDRSIEERSEQARWLRSLRDLAQEWLEGNNGLQGWVEEQSGKRRRVKKPVPIPTDAYVDLIFAFGLAQLGAHAESRKLLKQAGMVLLDCGDELHAFVFRAFRYRIEEALTGKPHAGLLSPEIRGELGNLNPFSRYAADRLRRHSRILEPHQHIDPYGIWVARISNISRSLFQLIDLSDRAEITRRITNLFAEASTQKESAELQAEMVCKALETALRMDEGFATAMLDRALSAFDALPDLDTLPENRQVSVMPLKARLLEQSWTTVAFFSIQGFIRPLLDRGQTLLQTQRRPEFFPCFLEPMAAQWLRALRRFGPREKVDRLITRLADIVLGGKDVEEIGRAIDFQKDRVSPLNVLLLVAAGWYAAGRHEEAERILQVIRSVLFQTAFPPRKQKSLACAYARTTNQMPILQARRVLEELFQTLKGVDEGFTTQSHFKVSMLEVIEATVLAVMERSQPMTIREPDAVTLGRVGERKASKR